MPSLATPMGRLLLAAVPTRYLLLARFGATIAAPLPSPLPVDVGALTVVDTNGIMSQSAGRLVINGTGATGDRVASPLAFARKAGRAFLGSVPTRTTISTSQRLGFAAVGTDSAFDIGFDYPTGASIRIKMGTGVIETVTIGSGEHHFAAIMRATGGFLLLRNGTSGLYTLHWVYNTITSDLFAKSYVTAGAQNWTLDDLRVTDLSLLDGRWGAEFGIATSRLAGALSAGQAYTHTADCILEFVVTTLPTSSVIVVDFRKVDANNSWYVHVAADGTIALQEWVAGSNTSRGSSAAAVVNGSRVVVTAEGATIKVYVDNVLKITYASATGFQTATQGAVRQLGNGPGAASDLVAWPRFVSLPSGV